jgi:hypothetical protein
MIGLARSQSFPVFETPRVVDGHMEDESARSQSK